MLFLVFSITIIVQAFFYLGIFSQFSFASKKKLKPIKNTAVSVIVACKNEAENLQELIPKLLIQNYFDYELILINDASTDETQTILEHYKKKNPKIKLLQIPQSISYKGNKKNALTQGIQLAKNEYLLFTDADCIPVSENWISSMVNQFSESKALILGYGAYQKTNTWLNKMIRYETVLTAWQYFAYAIAGMPYMGVGRNIAYTKTIFKKVSGFENHKHIRSGDDDLFVNQVANRLNTALCWERDAHTISQAPDSFSQWIQQKRRHITTATSYSKLHIFLLALFYISELAFFGLLFFVPFSTSLILLIVFRYVFYFITLHFAIRKLKEKNLLVWSIFLEPFLVIFQLYLFLYNIFYKPTKW